MTSTSARDRHQFKLIVALITLYIVWGSTYLAIRYAIETIPPFLMAGVRFLTAGILLYAWSRWRGAARPTRAQWKSTAIIGAFLLVGGNGGVVWAEKIVPSGLTAVLVAMVPLWMVLIGWIQRGRTRPGRWEGAGLALGFAGVFLLMSPGSAASGGAPLVGILTLMLASFSWAFGSLYSRKAEIPSSPLLTTAMEMLCGGLFMIAISFLLRENHSMSAVSGRSMAGLIYLITMGSLAGFTAYVWLLKHTTPTVASTYAYVNPVIAVFMGAAVGGETLTHRTVVAAAVIIGGVALLLTKGTAELSAQQKKNPASPG